MEIKNEITKKLLKRGFSNKNLLNNIGLISAIVDETIILIANETANQ